MPSFHPSPSHAQPILLCIAIALFSLSSTASAGDAGCARCGCQDCCKVCRLVREDKKVPVICWGMKCEDFCDQGPSCRGCKNCEEVCQSTEKDAERPLRRPQGLRLVRLDPRLLQRDPHQEETDEKDRHQNGPQLQMGRGRLCAECEAKTQDAVVPPGVAVPPPPKVNAK